MKKIITAVNNPNLNEKLKNENYIEVIGKDIQYKEGILEFLEKNNLTFIFQYSPICQLSFNKL